MIKPFRLLLATIPMAFLLSACFQAAPPPPAPGTLFFSQDSNANGLYEIDMDTGEATLVGAGITNTTAATVGLAGRGTNDPLIGSTWSTLVDIEQDGSAATQFSTESAEALAYSSDTGLVYTLINNTFESVSPNTGALVETLTSPGTDVEGIATNESEGVIYGICGDSQLRSYDISADSWSILFDTGLNLSIGCGLAYDAVEDVLYAIGDNDSPQTVYRIDVSAQTVTAIGDMNVSNSPTGGLAWVPGE